jgi:hypothetical protein
MTLGQVIGSALDIALAAVGLSICGFIVAVVVRSTIRVIKGGTC